MVHIYGMAVMSRRTTFSLDEETIIRLKKLATLWHISQAEVVRKAIKKAESDLNTKTGEKLDQLRQYHKYNDMSIDSVDEYLHELVEYRSSWDRN